MKRAALSTFAASLSVFCLLHSIAAPSLADSTAAPDFESVTVDARNVLPGFWRFPPHERAIVDFSREGGDIVANFTSMGPEKFCRIEHAESGYTFSCLEISERAPQATVDASRQVHLSWRAIFAPGCRWTFQGRFQSVTEITGHLGMTCPAVAGEKPELMTIAKMVLSENTPDTDGQAAYLKRLLEEMAKGPVIEPYTKLQLFSSNPNVMPIPDDVQQQRLAFLTPGSLRALGVITAVIYAGEHRPIVGWLTRPASGPLPLLLPASGHIRPPPPPESDGRTVLGLGPVYGKTQPVYAVEFENGERLCTLHRRADGVLDQFQCI
jgi:hypothetical protein